MFENIIVGATVVVDYAEDKFVFQPVAADFKHRIDENGYIVLEEPIAEY